MSVVLGGSCPVGLHRMLLGEICVQVSPRLISRQAAHYRYGP
ncbi:MAG TPA: hypothetical protein VI365_18385 [Trebonia sp.]